MSCLQARKREGSWKEEKAKWLGYLHSTKKLYMLLERCAPYVGVPFLLSTRDDDDMMRSEVGWCPLTRTNSC